MGTDAKTIFCNIDWDMLRIQKRALETIIEHTRQHEWEASHDPVPGAGPWSMLDNLEGILGLLDHIQDEGAEWYDPETVFGPMPWEDRLFKTLRDPDDVSSSEYRALYEHLQGVVESANISHDDPRQMAEATVKDLRHWLGQIERQF